MLPSHIDAYFTPKRPYGFTKQERDRIASQITQINGLITNEEKLKKCNFRFPTDISELIVILGIPRKSGLRYTFRIDRRFIYHYIYKTKKKIQKHS